MAKKRTTNSDRVGRIKRLLSRILTHPDLTPAEKTGAISEAGNMIVKDGLSLGEIQELRKWMGIITGDRNDREE